MKVQDAEIVRLTKMLNERDAEIARLRDRLERISRDTFFEPGEELAWFNVGEVNTVGAHTHINGPRNYFIQQADGLGSDQLFVVKRRDEETGATTIIGYDLPDWKTAVAVAQADFDSEMRLHPEEF